MKDIVIWENEYPQEIGEIIIAKEPSWERKY